MEKISNISSAPTIQTPIENSSIVEYEIDKETKLKMKFNDKIISLEVTQFSLPQKYYENSLTLEQLYKINKFFINFESAKDLVDWIIDSFKTKKSSIEFKDNKCVIRMTNPITNKTFELNLNFKEKDINTRVNYLEDIIAEQNKKINSLEERMKKLEEIITEYKELRKEKEEKKLIFDSEILNKEDQEMLISWLPRKPNKITLLLNSNKDGESTKTFMEKVNGKCPTLVIIKTTKGYSFGGYTTEMWKEGRVKDSNAFVFSMEKKKKYNIKQPENAIGFAENLFWLFGWSQNAIVIYENCKTRNDNYVDNKTYDINEKYELNGGERNFTVKSFEVYHVDY